MITNSNDMELISKFDSLYDSCISARAEREEVKRHIYGYEFLVVDKNRVVTVAITIGLFGGLVGGPIASLVYYDSPPEERFYIFIIPEIVGFICAGLMVYFSKLKEKSND
jgi:hypothetical protein